jgi:tripartite ATP-independent transporter DctM subunit
MSVAADAPQAQSSGASRPLAWIAEWLRVYSDAAAGIARVGVIVSIVLCGGATVATVFTTYVLGFEVVGGIDELAAYAFLWTIWMGVSLAIRHGEVTVVTFVRDRGPAWLQRSVRTFSGLSIAILLGYCIYYSTKYAFDRNTLLGHTTIMGIPQIYGVAAMTVGYYFIGMHYLARAAEGAQRLAVQGRASVRTIMASLTGAVVIGAAVLVIAWGILEAGGSPLLALGVIFVALTFAGNPIIFMLSIVGIIAVTGIAGLEFYPTPVPDVLFPFRTTLTAMGLSTFTELTVILMFLVVAEVMNASGMSMRLIAAASALLGHLRGGMAYVCQVTSALLSGVSGSATADAAIMAPVLVPAMEKEGYPRDVAAAVVSGASIKGPIGPISIMFIVYATLTPLSGLDDLLLSGIPAMILLLLLQAATIYIVVRRLGFFKPRPFPGVRPVMRAGLSAVPVLLIPVILIGGLLRGAFGPTQSGAVAVIVAVLFAMFLYGSLAPADLPRVLTRAGMETGVVMLLVGDSAILSRALQNNNFGDDLAEWIQGITDNKNVFLLIIVLLLLAVGLFLEPLPALYIFAIPLYPLAEIYGVNDTQFGLIVVFALVLALIHPPIGLVIFLVSSVAKVSVERLSIMIIPWLLVSLLVLFLVTYLPPEVVLVVANHPTASLIAIVGLTALAIAAVILATVLQGRRPGGASTDLPTTPT